MSEKVKVNLEVADAITYMQKKTKFTNYGIANLFSKRISHSDSRINLCISILKNYFDHTDDLLKVLILGCEIDKSPEEELKELFHRRLKSANEHKNWNEIECYKYDIGYTDGIFDALKILGVKVNGINETN